MHVIAYIDAGTGSYILAAIASGVAGAWFFLHAQISKIKRKITGKPLEVEVEEEVDVDAIDSTSSEITEMESVEVEDPQTLEK